MRAKTLLLTAALSAAGVATSMAQTTVYSVNAVGYINLVANPGFNMVANQLNTANNSMEEVFANAPGGIAIYKFNGTGFSINSKDPDFGWDRPAEKMLPGEAAFLRNPTSTAMTITLVGEVPQGPLTTSLPAGFSMVSSQVPQEGKLATDLGFPAAANDAVYTFKADGSGYNIFANDPDFGWDPAEPVIKVGQGFFVKKAAAATWTRNFSVNTQ